jgi:hypothetical protein
METKNSKNEKLFLKSSERNPYKRLYNDINKRIEKRKKKEDEINLSIKKNSLFKISNPLTKKINRNMNDLNKNIINENNDIYLFQQFSNLSSFHKRNYTTNFIYNNDNKSYYFSNNNVKIRNSSKKNKYKNKLEYRSITPNIREYN